ncbi:kinase-like protein [Thelephora ganbajun]|uniref:Kinase-like protein n=1 Tax=Thelephora ganbajun TaxID=370292 RepID=A0ACB6Z4Z5_THEGA|nr:kinase-like protein [Thelephora ganbajun]
MPHFTLADINHLHLASAASTRANQVVSKANGTVIIDGVLDDDRLTVSLRSPDSRRTLLERLCVRFNARELPKISGLPDHTNRFCDVSAGETSEGLGLVIESHRCYSADSQGNASVIKRFYRHALVCSGLAHANIVPFLGVFSSNKFPYACVFESMGTESLVQYLASNPCTSRLKLLVEVARGLQHIHDLDIVHGSIRGANIHVDDRGTARIAGFASATVILQPDIALEDVDDSVESNVSRWCSPEILHPAGLGLTKARTTKASDIYSFGMLAFEIFSGRVPFYDRTDTAAVVTVITTDERPSRPAHQQLFDQLWEMMETCWRKDPSQRPTIVEVVTFLEKFHRFRS